jgi:hypothetical protein
LLTGVADHLGGYFGAKAHLIQKWLKMAARKMYPCLLLVHSTTALYQKASFGVYVGVDVA